MKHDKTRVVTILHGLNHYSCLPKQNSVVLDLNCYSAAAFRCGLVCLLCNLVVSHFFLYERVMQVMQKIADDASLSLSNSIMAVCTPSHSISLLKMP